MKTDLIQPVVNTYGFKRANVHGLTNCLKVKTRYFWILCEQTNESTTINSDTVLTGSTSNPCDDITFDSITTLLTTDDQVKSSKVMDKQDTYVAMPSITVKIIPLNSGYYPSTADMTTYFETMALITTAIETTVVNTTAVDSTDGNTTPVEANVLHTTPVDSTVLNTIMMDATVLNTIPVETTIIKTTNAKIELVISVGMIETTLPRTIWLRTMKPVDSIKLIREYRCGF